VTSLLTSFARSVAYQFKTLWENQRTLKKVLISGDTSYFNSTRNFSTSTEMPTTTTTTVTPNTLCGDNEFSCSEGAPDPCIPNTYVCDGYNDCGNGRDETNCDHV